MERTHGGTRALTTELKYLNLDPSSFQHLPEEEEDDEDNIYYGIEKGKLFIHIRYIRSRDILLDMGLTVILISSWLSNFSINILYYLWWCHIPTSAVP